MSSQDYIHRLVHSLTQNEKRYMTLLASTFQKNEKPRYLVLMEALLKMDEYDEDVLKKRLRSPAIVKQLPIEKNNLYKFILKGLKLYHSQGRVDTAHADVIFHGRLLSEKGFYAQAIKLLESERVDAESFGKFAFLLESVRLQKWIHIDKAYGNPHVKLPELHSLEKKYLVAYTQHVEMSQVREQMHQLLSGEYEGRSEKIVVRAQELISELDGVSGNDCLSFPALNDFHWSHIYFATIVKNGSLAQVHFNELLRAWRENEAWRLREVGEYKKLLSNYLSHCHENGLFAEFEEVIAEIKGLPVYTLEEESSLFKNLSLLELLYYINMRKWSQAEQMVPYIEKGIARFALHIRESRELAIYYNVFVMYFFQGKYNQSLGWLQRILNYKRTDFREDIQRAARLLQLVLLYELGNRSVLEDFIRATTLFLQRKGVYNLFEEKTLAHLKQLVKASTKSDEKEVFRLFFTELNNMIPDMVAGVPLGKNEIALWAKSRFLERSVKEVLEDQGS